MTDVLWTPSRPEASNMGRFMSAVNQKHALKLKTYHQLHEWSIAYPGQFWKDLYEFYALLFDTPPESILENEKDMINARWFRGARFNFAQKLLSRTDDHPALVSVDEQGQRLVLSYRQLRTEVARCAASLKSRGIQPGSRVAAVMPNVAATIIAMLATTSLGAIWASCSPDFGSQAIIDRLGQIEASLLFICDGHSYQGKKHPADEKIMDIAKAMPSLKEMVIYPHIAQPIDKSSTQTPISFWEDFLKNDATEPEFAALPFDHPLYILFSSGTTGTPKCIVHGAGGTLLQHIKELGLHTDITANDNLCFYTTCGWMMWNWMVSVLSLGATLTLYEGSPAYPDAGRLFKLIDEEQITVFGTSAKFISAIEKEGLQPQKDYQLKSLRCILSTGSPLLPKNYDFVYQQIKKDLQLCSISGGTDIVSCFALGNPILPIYRGELQCIGLGLAVKIYDENGRSVEQERGELVCTKPFPSMPIAFWNDPEKEKYKQAYFDRFPGIWAHGDFAEVTAHHGLIIYGRSDAVLNPGGVRIGTAEIYRQIEKIPEIVESVVIGQPWQDDVRVVLFVKLQEGLLLDKNLETLICQTLRRQASPRHVPAKILQVKDIPRTINGKIVELAVRKAVQGETINNLDSLANPQALEEFKNRSELSH